MSLLCSPNAVRRCPHPAARRGAFTFVEILFAVIVLGIGFIMLAGMFPIAIQQTQSTLQETTAAGVARNGINILSQLADGNLFDVNPNNVSGQPGIVEDLYRRLPSTYSNYSTAVTYAANALVTYPTGSPTSVYQSLQAGNKNNSPTAANSTWWIQVPDKWATIKASMINSSDNRFAWSALYRRDYGSPYAQIFLFVSQCRHTSQYIGNSAVNVPNDVDWNSATVPAVNTGPNLPYLQYPTILQPKKVSITLTYGSASTPSTIKFLTAPSVQYTGPYTNGSGANVSPVATGNYVVISSGIDASGNAGSANSRVYRIGNATTTANTWELQPGADMASATENTTAADAYILGCDYDNVNAAGGPTYVNIAPDIGLYVSFIAVH